MNQLNVYKVVIFCFQFLFLRKRRIIIVNLEYICLINSFIYAACDPKLKTIYRKSPLTFLLDHQSS